MNADYLSVEYTYSNTGLDFTPYFCPQDKTWDNTAEWEMREVGVSNEKGEFVFRQESVESPKEWSQTATNIVASKYFRGIQGTPERETSIRGLINRVITAITEHGKKNSYFQSEKSAAIFKNELGYMLLHQMVAFNSPVWFNIGASGTKQQASACQPYHSLICTPSGLIPIGKLVEDNAVGLEVYDRVRKTKILAVKQNGEKEVFKVTTASGASVEATADHLFYTTPPDLSLTIKPLWKRVDELTLDDYLFVDRTSKNEEGDTARFLLQGSPFHDIEKIISIKSTGVQPVYDIQTESENYLSNYVVAHNCFILNVEDDMRSILQWVTDEAMIFKYGSGAGANLSKLRETDAHLSGGGPASGPISFMKIADSAAGVIKSGGTCLAPDQRIYTNEGPIEVQKLAEKEDFIVLSYDPPAKRYKAKRARAWLAGRKEVLEVTTDKGAFRMSYDHPIKLSTGEAIKAQELKEGMSLWKCSIDTFGPDNRIRVHLQDGKGGKEFLHRLVAQDISTIDHKEKIKSYLQVQNTVLQNSNRAHDKLQLEEHNHMINTAFKVLNAGYKMDTLEEYLEGIKLVGTIDLN
ncbi:MAG: hypothetical protein ACREF7_00360, partial [Candidatus Saccharimonadales bacterium]